jgi:tetratricopeptide (TPR) repeat protein
MPEFTSEGFDLDALASATEDVVLELGGKVVPGAAEAATQEPKKSEEKEDDPMSAAEAFKQQGNECFKRKEWQRAHELYSDAINATPGMTGAELLKIQDAWQEEQQKKMREELRKQDVNRKQKKDNDDTDESPPEKKEPVKFQAPPHAHGEMLAVYYSNRAAASMQMAQGEEAWSSSSTTSKAAASHSALDDADDAPPSNPRLEEAVQDCSIALLLHPLYVKALVRRSTAYERMHNTEAALQDAVLAQKLEPYNSAIRMSVSRLQKAEDERLEKLKTETLEKLKDLGNSILGNFGLSLDNFNAQKDPNSGSYSISFNQNK